MGNIWAIGKREFASYFSSVIAYLSIAVFLLMMGLLFFFMEGFWEVGQATMRPFFVWAPRLFILLLPAVSMRLISEERRTGSLELLVTMPIRDIEVMLGKLLGAFWLLLLTLAVTLLYPIIISTMGDLDWGPVIGGYLGLVLLGLAYLSIGLMASTWTDNQIVAFITALLICSFFYLIDDMAGVFGEQYRDTMAHLSFEAHFENIAKGVLDSRDILFYLSAAVLAVTAGTFSLESRRWI